MEDRATIVKNRATFTDELTTDSGTRGLSALQQKLQSKISVDRGPLETNPVAASGSWLMHNEAVKTKQRSLDTGAGSATDDVQMFRSMPAAAVGIPIPLLYMDAEASGNLNAIIELMKRASGRWTRYRTMWHGFYKKLARFILDMQGYTKPVIVDVDAAPMLEDGLEEYTSAVAKGKDRGLIPRLEAARLYLVRLGAKNVDEILEQMRMEDTKPEPPSPVPSLNGKQPMEDPNDE
jgi:hypothetical protein